MKEGLVKTRRSLAGVLEPGDATRYEFVAVQMFDCVEVVILNDGFFDKITFINNYEEPKTFRGDKTNPWTIKAAKKILNVFIELDEEERKDEDCDAVLNQTGRRK